MSVPARSPRRGPNPATQLPPCDQWPVLKHPARETPVSERHQGRLPRTTFGLQTINPDSPPPRATPAAFTPPSYQFSPPAQRHPPPGRENCRQPMLLLHPGPSPSAGGSLPSRRTFFKDGFVFSKDQVEAFLQRMMRLRRGRATSNMCFPTCNPYDGQRSCPPQANAGPKSPRMIF